MITHLSKPHRIEEKPSCPECGATLDGATGVNCHDHPKEGDVTVCLYCANVMLFTGEFPHLALRSATNAELAEIVAEQPLLLSVISAVREKLDRRAA